MYQQTFRVLISAIHDPFITQSFLGTTGKIELMRDRMNKLGEQVENFAQGIRNHGEF